MWLMSLLTFFCLVIIPIIISIIKKASAIPITKYIKGAISLKKPVATLPSPSYGFVDVEKSILIVEIAIKSIYYNGRNSKRYKK